MPPGVDLCAIGTQKAMGGPAGVSAVSVSARAWEGSMPRGVRSFRHSPHWVRH